MSTPKKCIALSIAAASSLIVACASNHSAPPIVAAHPPMVVDNYSTPSAADMYAQRYPSVVTQVSAGAQQRFVICEDDCPGVTPKTPLANLNAAVARRAQDKLRARSRADVQDDTLLAASQPPVRATALNARSRPLISAVSRPAAAIAAQAVTSNARKARTSGEEGADDVGAVAFLDRDALPQGTSVDQTHADAVGEQP